MTESKRYLNGCKTCDNYKDKIVEKASPNSKGVIFSGYIALGDELYGYVVVESDKKAAKKHFIFTTTSHHVGAEMVEVRAALNAEITKISAHLFGPDCRLINNSGNASNMDHYHCHIIVPGLGERLPRAVANVQKVIEGLDKLPSGAKIAGVKTALDQALLQQKAK